MDDNLPPAQAATFALPGHSILAIEGPDAARFAHAQFMSDVASLADGHWQWSGWLTPKGRVIALFALLRFDAGKLWLLLPDADAAQLRESLQRFVFRSKVTLKAPGDAHASGAFSGPSIAKGARFAQTGDGVVELDVGAPASPRTLRVGAATAPMDPGATARWTAFDIEHGLPRLPASQVGQWTPQQLSLDRLNAYSIKKGCYPGQEIVARTHFLGQAKRGLVLLDAYGALQPGDEVGDATRAIGTAVSVAVGAGGSTALAVLPLERDKATELSAHAIALRERPLLDGLAR